MGKIKFTIIQVVFLCYCLPGYTQVAPMPTDSIAKVAILDSLQKTLYFIDSVGPHWKSIAGMGVYHIEHTYISGRRGMSDQEWDRRTQLILEKVNQHDDHNWWQIYAARYLGLLMHDAHFKFPDGGQLNRSRFFKETDTIFPIWVKTWKDGSVYCVKDYSGEIPRNARILSVNGHSANEIALINRAIGPGEEANTMAMMNAQYEPDPKYWNNFTNYLFYEGINAPYEIVYTPQGSIKADTIVLEGIVRDDRFKQYKRSGDKYKNEATILHLPNGMKAVEYENRGGGIGVLSLNSFWGTNVIELLILRKDSRYKKQLKRAMRRVQKDGITDLVLDLSKNTGGMGENVYFTLDYFTDKPVTHNQIYHITDLNRDLVKMNISNSREISEVDRDSLINYIDKLTSGTVFATDTVCRFSYIPSSPKHKYDGNVYLLTGPMTYSAAQVFTQYCQKLEVGPVAGEHSGGYTEITGGNTMQIPQPTHLQWLRLAVPFSATRIFENEDPYDYPPVDIPIEQPFEEWLEGENHNLDRLIELIRSGNISTIDKPNAM
jgi:hypothetical protein